MVESDENKENGANNNNGTSQNTHSTLHTHDLDINYMRSDEFLESSDSTNSLNFEVVAGYIVSRILGEGSYGKVVEALHFSTLCRRAIKMMSRYDVIRKPFGIVNVLNEIHALRRLDHINIVKLYDVLLCKTKDMIYLILEYCASSIQLMVFHNLPRKMPPCQCNLYFTQLIEGLEYLHSQHIIHNDIKPSNLLVTLDHRVKICDFGTVTNFDNFRNVEHLDNFFGTPAFQPPEVIDNPERFVGAPKDVWSSGVCLCYMMSGKLPFKDDSLLGLYEKIKKSEPIIDYSDIDDDFPDLLLKMLEKDHNKRINIFEIKRHAWFNKNHMKLPFSPFPFVDPVTRGGIKVEDGMEHLIHAATFSSTDPLTTDLPELMEYFEYKLDNL